MLLGSSHVNGGSVPLRRKFDFEVFYYYLKRIFCGTPNSFRHTAISHNPQALNSFVIKG